MRDRNSWTLARVTRGKSSRRRHARVASSMRDCIGDGGELWRGFHCDDNIALGGIGEVEYANFEERGLALCNFTFTNPLMFRHNFWKFSI